MTLQEIAGYLKVPSRTVLWMAQSGEIPATKVGAEWRFVRSQVDQWLSGGKNVLNNIASIPTIQEVGQSAKLPYPISTDRIIMDLEPGPKEHILSQLIQPAVKHGIIFDPHTYLSLLLDRENLVTTAIGNGIAIPHVHNPEISHVRETAAVIGICKKGVNYESLDGMPTHLFVLLCTNSIIAHLRILARTMLIFRAAYIAQAYCKARTKYEVIALITKSSIDVSVQC